MENLRDFSSWNIGPTLYIPRLECLGFISALILGCLFQCFTKENPFDLRGLKPVMLLQQTMIGLKHLHSHKIGYNDMLYTADNLSEVTVLMTFTYIIIDQIYELPSTPVD